MGLLLARCKSSSQDSRWILDGVIVVWTVSLVIVIVARGSGPWVGLPIRGVGLSVSGHGGRSENGKRSQETTVVLS